MHFFPRTRDLLVSQKSTQRHFFSTLHPLSPVIFATAVMVAFVLLRNSRFNFHCYTQRDATPTQKCSVQLSRSLHKHFVATKKRLLSRKTRVRRDKHVFVATKVCLYFCERQNYVCCDRTFVATKMILAAAPANDS